MLDQASMLQHFGSPTASNGSPLKALLRRDFARGESLEQKRQEASLLILLQSKPHLHFERVVKICGDLCKSVSQYSLRSQRLC